MHLAKVFSKNMFVVRTRHMSLIHILCLLQPGGGPIKRGRIQQRKLQVLHRLVCQHPTVRRPKSDGHHGRRGQLRLKRVRPQLRMRPRGQTLRSRRARSRHATERH